ncbi:peptide ABC transporter substrate-binding protein [Treponema zioleckii]|uniref:peptide ABC transporter substrate-binding protein n=1 Tax=Treponema zioleckii TaxID=331680 RepID=UPI00168ABC88|nr:peptide ABC transporter substrate-binding protein [Treponema zioleckii]
MKKIFYAALAVFASAVFMIYPQTKKSGYKTSELIINNGSEPDFLDPSKIQSVPEQRIYLALFEGLVSYDSKTCAPVPGVAESWERRGKNNEILTFHLRKTTWSDGTPITAQTVIDSWLYYLAPSTAAEYAYMPAAVIKGAADYNAGKTRAETVGLRAVDDKTFEITLVGAVPYAEAMMAAFSFPILPMHVIQKYGNEWTKPEHFVGNGPFVLESWIPQEKITVVPNEKYWNKKNVFLSRITFLPIENLATAYNAFKNHEIDWDTGVPLEKLGEIKFSKKCQTAPCNATYYYEFNINDPVLSDVRVRKALAKAIDKKQLVEKLLRGGQVVSDAFVPPMEGYKPATGNAFNVEEAKALLAEAGYPDGKGFPTMTLIYNTNEAHKKIAEYVQGQWKENLGIDVVLENLYWARFLQKRQSNDFQIARAGWVGDLAEPANFLELCLSASGNNDGRYSSSDFDALLLQASEMPAGAERDDVLRRAEEILITRDQALLPVYYYVTHNLIDLDKWEGWYTNILDVHPYVGLKARY